MSRRERDSGFWLFPAVILWVGSWLLTLAVSGYLGWLLNPVVR